MSTDQPSPHRQLFTLFLLCAVPIHLWSILMLLNDYAWVVEQHSLDTYIGYVDYALLAALIESLVVAGLFYILGLLVSRKWMYDKRLAVLVAALIAVSVWAIIGQVFFLLRESPPGWLAWILLRLPFHRTEALLFLWVLVIASIALPVFFILRGSKLEPTLLALLDRLTVLAGFYLVLDGFALLLVVYRLIRGQG